MGVWLSLYSCSKTGTEASLLVLHSFSQTEKWDCHSSSCRGEFCRTSSFACIPLHCLSKMLGPVAVCHLTAAKHCSAKATQQFPDPSSFRSFSLEWNIHSSCTWSSAMPSSSSSPLPSSPSSSASVSIACRLASACARALPVTMRRNLSPLPLSAAMPEWAGGAGGVASRPCLPLHAHPSCQPPPHRARLPDNQVTPAEPLQAGMPALACCNIHRTSTGHFKGERTQ